MGKINTTIHPDKDGITHINMYSKARTPFGKMLSDFYHYPITTPEGKFESVEAYWYYLSLPESVNRDKIRKCYGWLAKKTGRDLRKEAGEENLIFDPDFENKILTAIEQKVRGNVDLLLPEYKDLPIIII